MKKGIILEVTDKKLLARTGGIVQGMSGSPIIQDGKLIGAVTHVFVNDPKKGYQSSGYVRNLHKRRLTKTILTGTGVSCSGSFYFVLLEAPASSEARPCQQSCRDGLRISD